MQILFQQAAMALYKVRPKKPYYFWAVMSIVLQATTGGVDEQLALNMLLPLAERMVAKMAKESKIEQEQETHLYLMILELQRKFKEALAVLDGELGQQLKETSAYWELFNFKRIDYLKKLEKWRMVNSLAKEILQTAPDQWNVYLDYITSVFYILDHKESDDGANEVTNILFLTYDKNYTL